MCNRTAEEINRDFKNNHPMPRLMETPAHAYPGVRDSRLAVWGSRRPVTTALQIGDALACHITRADLTEARKGFTTAIHTPASVTEGGQSTDMNSAGSRAMTTGRLRRRALAPEAVEALPRAARGPAARPLVPQSGLGNGALGTIKLHPLQAQARPEGAGGGQLAWPQLWQPGRTLVDANLKLRRGLGVLKGTSLRSSVHQVAATANSQAMLFIIETSLVDALVSLDLCQRLGSVSLGQDL